MSASLTFIGLNELRKELLNLPAALTYFAAEIVNRDADAAAAEIRTAYPEGETGNLQKGVRVVDQKSGPHTVRRVIRSTAKHVHLYEYGSQNRVTKLGYNRGHMFSKYGFTPGRGANVFVPIVERRRREMFERLLGVIEKSGLDVRR